MNTCKITVLKKTYDADLADTYRRFILVPFFVGLICQGRLFFHWCGSKPFPMSEA